MQLEKTMELIRKDEQVLSGLSRIKYFPFVMKRGRGAEVEDLDGNHFIDLLSSAASINVGHSHPAVVERLRQQLDEFTNYCTAYVYSEPLVELGEKLAELTPGSFEKRVTYGLTGSDANDGAIKLARAYTGRSKIVSFIGAYHGSTYGALSLTAISLNMRRKIGPMLPDVHHIEYPTCYRCRYDKEPATCGLPCLGLFKDSLKSYLPAEEIAAIIMEPIQGDGGLIVPPQRYMDELITICRDKGILFVSEEVQQGMGRTGKWWGIEHFDIEPDMILAAKALGSGIPISAIIARKEISESVGPPAHLFTMSGSAFACAAANATIDVIRDENLVENAAKMGEHLKARFRAMQEKYDIIGDVRGHGLSIGVDLVKDRDTKEGHSTAAKKICYRCWERGVILIFLADGVLRVQPPLVISEEQLDRALDIVEQSIQDYLNDEIPDEILDFAKGW